MSSTASQQSWKDALAPHAQARTDRAALQVATSLLPYLLLCVTSYLTLGVSTVLTVLLVIPTAGFLVRTFVVFHDCAHGSLFPSRSANHRVGVVLGLFVLAPFRQWQHEHSVHHATSGDLDRRGIGDVMTLTVSEYSTMAWYKRVGYRMFRNPIVMFGLGPIAAMIIGPRIPERSARPRQRRSVLLTDVTLVAAIALICWAIGWRDFLVVWAPAAMLAGSAGVWLFYVQHQFEDAYWQRGDDWGYAEAALRGSTFLKLPRLLGFFTADIGLHHVHHLNARIPNYNLRRAHDSHPIFSEVPTISMWDGFRATRYKLWDEQSRKMLTFAQARRVVASADAGTDATPVRMATQGAMSQ
jgi:omega-6 fatty acid desaturase (delta-12 desaturase)